MFVMEHGRHRVWNLRQSGLSWDEIAAQLGIGSDRTRAWYLKWSPQLEARYLHAWGNRTVRASVGADEVRDLSSKLDPQEEPIPPEESESGGSL